MSIASYLQLALLALVDSTSIGTLLIPMWMLMLPGQQRITNRVLLFLGTLAVFYWSLGALMLVGVNIAGSASGGLAGLWDLQGVKVAGLVVGGGMLTWALFSDTPKKKAAAKTGPKMPSRPVKKTPAAEARWQQRISKALSRPAGVVVLAVLAGLLELPTMLPYLAAMGILTSANVPTSPSLLILAGYCLVMLTPALALLGLRTVLGIRVDKLLQRLNSTLSKYSGETFAWVVGIVGFLLLRSAIVGLTPVATWMPHT